MPIDRKETVPMWKVLALSELKWCQGFLQVVVQQDTTLQPVLDRVEKVISLVVERA